MDLLTIVVPVYGQWAYTRDCLRSLRRCTPGRFYRVVVADGASPDETGTECGPLLAELFGDLGEHRRSAQRLSFAGACNLGAAGAASEYLFFLNNDTLLLPGWLDPLIAALRGESRPCVAAPLLLYPEIQDVPDWPLAGRVQHAGIALDPNKHPVHPFHGFPAGHPAVRRRRRLQAVSGAAMLVPRRLFEDLGGFYEGFRNGSEDLDLCASVRRRGGRCLYEPQSVLYHYSGATPGRYAHVRDNATLLNKRCRDAFVPDLQRLAGSHGFILALNEWLEIVVREQAVEQDETVEDSCTQGGGDPLRGLLALLERRPLLESAYVKLANQQKVFEEYGDAARTLQVRAFLFPGVASFRAAGAACAQVHDQAGVSRWRAREQAAQERLADLPGLLGQARAALDWFSGNGQDEMKNMYLQWIENVKNK